MARRLPWKRASEASPSASPATGLRRTPKAESPAPRAPPKAAPQNAVRTPLSRRQERALDSDPIRSPSTSPPPERPEEKFMIPGPLHDDKYRMVEDEFLHTAQRFTAHLHRAEYDRLKALAKSQNAATIREIERPVVAGLPPTHTARQRQISIKREASQRKALQDTGHELLFPRAGSSLQGLMDVPSKENKPIMPCANASFSSSFSAKTRAAAGYHSSRSSPPQRPPPERASESRREPILRDSSREKLDNLNRHSTETPTRTSRPKAAFHTPTHSSPKPPYSSSSVVRPIAATDSSTIRPNRSRNALSEDRKRRASFLDREDDDDDDDDPFGINERRMNRKKSREQFRKPEIKISPKEKEKVSLDTIPSFL